MSVFKLILAVVLIAIVIGAIVIRIRELGGGGCGPQRKGGKVSVPNRFDYVKYDDAALKLQAQFKLKFMEIEGLIETGLPTAGRYRSLALTALEEAYAWVGKAVRDEQIVRDAKSATLQEGRSKS